MLALWTPLGANINYWIACDINFCNCTFQWFDFAFEIWAIYCVSQLIKRKIVNSTECLHSIGRLSVFTADKKITFFACLLNSNKLCYFLSRIWLLARRKCLIMEQKVFLFILEAVVTIVSAHWPESNQKNFWIFPLSRKKWLETLFVFMTSTVS